MYKKISSKLLIFRAQKAVITPVIIGKSPKFHAWIDGASPCVENCQNQGGRGVLAIYGGRPLPRPQLRYERWGGAE